MAGDQRPADKPRRRKTGRLVGITDRLAAFVITLGGQGVLVAMLAICLFLVATTLPLFRGGQVTDSNQTAEGIEAAPTVGVEVFVTDRGHTLIFDPGGVSVVDEYGAFVARADVPELVGRVTSVARRSGEVGVLLGLDSGIIVPVSIEFAGVLVDGGGAGAVTDGWRPATDAEATSLAPRGVDADATYLLHSDSDGVRLWTLAVRLEDEIRVPDAAGAIRAVGESRVSSRSSVLFAGTDSGYSIGSVRTTPRLDGGAGRTRVRWSEVPARGGAADARWAFAGGAGAFVAEVSPGGAWFWTPGTESWREMEGVGSGEEITAAALAAGGKSLVLGRADGSIESWTFVASDEGAERFRRARRVGGSAAPVASLGIGSGGRAVSVGYADGSVAMIHLTSGKAIVRVDGDGSSVLATGHAPREDTLAAVSDGALRVWSVEPGHPVASWSSLFGKVLYEGYDKPEWVYQSTGGDEVEAKFSLVPLIWGTLKATVVTMLISIPVGVLAAVYSSEFVPWKIRRAVKPTIELMASLPSVVLGFIAAMVVAPFVREHLAAMLASFVLVPLCVFLAASVWASIPVERVRKTPWTAQFLLVVAAIAVGVVIAITAGPALVPLLVGEVEGGVVAWLQGSGERVGGGWFVVLLPLAGAAVLGSGLIVRVLTACLHPKGLAVLGVVLAAWCASWIGAGIVTGLDAVTSLVWSLACVGGIVGTALLAAAIASVGIRVLPAGRLPGRLHNLVRGVGVLVLIATLAACGAWVLGLSGFDPRQALFGSYSQRNTLVVGVIMGFAVIPLIYTISEDALRAVPASLRAASLGTGATRWQTAVRVVLPVAGSGIFSACMIGLGRAVGETMIVLMATGSTPEMSINIFSGFRSLAANIAIELPEAPQGGTHYRVLFLCGLVLFILTLAVNTTAEVVRQRFRKRNAAL